jgi:hypothetical protein
MAKLTPELREALLERVAKTGKQRDALVWLKKHHGVAITPQALSTLVRKNSSSRADTAKVVAREHIARTLPADLAEFDRVQARNLELLELAQAEALADPSTKNVDKVAKLTAAYLKADEQKKKAMGLDQPDELVGGLADLLGLAFPDS